MISLYLSGLPLSKLIRVKNTTHSWKLIGKCASFLAIFVTHGIILCNSFSKIRLHPHIHKFLSGSIDLKKTALNLSIWKMCIYDHMQVCICVCVLCVQRSRTNLFTIVTLPHWTEEKESTGTSKQRGKGDPVIDNVLEEIRKKD